MSTCLRLPAYNTSEKNMANSDNIPPFVENVPVARELGILFAFLVPSLVIIAVYALVWRGKLGYTLQHILLNWSERERTVSYADHDHDIVVQQRGEERDRLRREQLVAQGVHHGRGGLHETILDHEILFMAGAEAYRLKSTHSPSSASAVNSHSSHTGTNGAASRLRDR
ncbi:hypothetical protein ARAM_004802, partial [Aspergillus rambellii]